MSLKFKKISGSTPYLLNSASTAEELTLALEDYMRTGAQIIFQHDGEDCILTSFEYKTGIESTVIAYFVTPKKKLLKVDIGAGYDLVITESEFTPETDTTLTQSGKPADAKATGEAITSLKSTINDIHTPAEIWMVGNNGGDIQRINFMEGLEADGLTGNIEIVGTLPDSITVSTDTEFYIYIVKSTGIAYLDIGSGAITVGFVATDGFEGFDKGWTDDINKETEEGIYCVLVELAEKKDITWENLQDKPFGEITENLGDTITWDGNIDESKDVVASSTPFGNGTAQYVKVSDCVPTFEELNSNTKLTSVIKTNDGYVSTDEVVEPKKGSNGYIYMGVGMKFVAVVPTDNFAQDSTTFPEKGVYFLLVSMDDTPYAYATKLTIPNYNFGTKTTIKKIDEKYLPDTILIKSDSAEIWIIDDDVLENLTEQMRANGATINIEVVDTLPESLELSSEENMILNIYIVNSTGIAYLDFGSGTMTFGVANGAPEGYDKGWSTDISAETEGGFYCVRTEKNVPTKEYVDNSIANAIGNGGGGGASGGGITKQTFTSLTDLALYIAANPTLIPLKIVLANGTPGVVTDDTTYNIPYVSEVNVIVQEGMTVVSFSTVTIDVFHSIGMVIVNGSVMQSMGAVNNFDGNGAQEGEFIDLESGTVTALFV